MSETHKLNYSFIHAIFTYILEENQDKHKKWNANYY